MSQFAGRVEAKFTVPSSTTCSATNTGGGPTSTTMTAGSYFWTAAGTVSGGLATFQSVLNSTRAASYGSWSVTMSTGATGTGLITVDCTSGAKLTKTGGVANTFDSGASSVQTITADGFVEITVSALGVGYMFGLATTDPDANFTSINYAFYCDGATIRAYELGVSVWSTGVTYAVGDVMRVNRTGTTVTFLKNGVVQYTSATASTGALMIDTSIYTSAAAIKAIRLASVSGATTTYSTITWQNVTNVTTGTDTFSLAWTSTGWRDMLGFAADISSAVYPQVGTLNPRGVWRPNCPLSLAEATTAEAPEQSDLRTTQSPTGVGYGLVGNEWYEHGALTWPYVPKASAREASATYTKGSWEWFYKETQLGLGSTFFSVLAPIQVWDHASVLLGSDLNSGLGTDGWTIKGLSGPKMKLAPEGKGWDGLYVITIPGLISSG